MITIVNTADRKTFNERNSSIELLKLIAVVMIVISHSMPNGGIGLYASGIDICSATTNVQLVIASFFNNLGQIGNAIFVICSAWFLLDNGKVNVKKVMYSAWKRMIQHFIKFE